MSAEIECAACGESVPHTMTHGLEGEPALWNDRLVAKGSQYAKCDEMTAEKWLTYLEQSATIATLTAERDELSRAVRATSEHLREFVAAGEYEFEAQTAPEAFLQQEIKTLVGDLRATLDAVEGTSS